MKHVKKFENMKSGVYDIYGKYLKSKFSGCFEVKITPEKDDKINIILRLSTIMYKKEILEICNYFDQFNFSITATKSGNFCYHKFEVYVTKEFLEPEIKILKFNL